MQVLALALLLSTSARLGTILPDLPATARPNPEPALPASFDPFAPAVTATAPAASAPVVAEWTRTGQPNSVVALTGSHLSSSAGDTSDTQFQVFGQNAGGTFSGNATILRQDGMKAALVLPPGLPTNSEYLVWPVNSAGAGYPVAVNTTEAWWIGPNAATRGNTVSVFGRNLAHQGATSYVYIQKAGMAGVWATVTAANPYKADFTVPSTLANGAYQVWIHNGHGGHYGWSGPLTLTVNDGTPWTSQQFNVKTYGAKGDGVTDDEAAIEAAVEAASHSPWSTVYLPAGTYMVSRGFTPPSQVRWLGDGPAQTIIRANSGFVKPPASTWDGRRCCLLFSNNDANSVTFQGLTIDANGNMNGYLPTPVYMRFGHDVRFLDVTINAKGYGTADFHGNNRLFLQNCSLVGTGNGVFFGASTQVFVAGCHVYGTNDANTMLTWWGAEAVSCTNTTGQDFDNTQADGWAQGRFVYGSSQWGSNRDFYVGDCTTQELAVRPAVADSNSGEQLLWENGTRYSAKPTFATATTVGFAANAFFSDAGLPTGSYDAVIVDGTGLGQHRKIVACAGSTITVAPAWNVMPDLSSTIIIAAGVSRCAVYHNTLQGKSDYLTRDTASAGIQPYGNSFDFIADSNTISQVRHGIYLWGMSETSLSPQSLACVYFNYIANNTVHDCVGGIVTVSHAWNGWPASDPYPGISCLGNTCAHNTVDSVSSGLCELASQAPVGDQVDLSIFDHNTVTHTPAVFDLELTTQVPADVVYNDLSAEAFAPTPTAGLILASRASLGSAQMTAAAAPVVTPATGSAPAVVPVDPVMPAPPLQALVPASPPPISSVPALGHTKPGRVVTVKGSPHGSVVTTSFALRHEDASDWTITSDSPWLTATLASQASRLEMICNPATLTPGTYTGSVMITRAGEVRHYTVTFTVE